jgi:GT2 family glycosyltransferase
MAPAISERIPAISVITPTRNRLGFLREAVASVQSQSFGDWEMIVVDDCSQDDTWDWLQGLGDGRIRAVRMQEHRERSAARNAALKQARGEYVLFLDDDDWLLDGALARLFGALQRRPTAIGAVGAFIYKNSWGSWNRAAHPRCRVFGTVWPDLLFGWIPMPGQTLHRRSAVIEAGAFCETMSLGEDYEFLLRFWQLGPAVLIPRPVLVYRIHPGQTNKPNVWELTAELRRMAAASRGEKERERAERSIQADRLIQQALVARKQGQTREAFLLWRRVIQSGPWLLASPVSRALILETGWQCFAGVALNRQLLGGLQRVKRACLRAFRGELRPPAVHLPSSKLVRGEGNNRS